MASDAGLTRFELDGTVTHRKGQQFVNGKGYAGDGFEEVHRIEPHGFASHPVKGGIGALMQARGNRDSGYIFGGENPSLRPDIPEGATAIYDHLGNVIRLVGTSVDFDFKDKPATMKAGSWQMDGPVTFNAGTATIEGDLTINGNLILNGNLKVVGNIELVGSMTATGSIVDGDGDGGA